MARSEAIESAAQNYRDTGDADGVRDELIKLLASRVDSFATYVGTLEGDAQAEALSWLGVLHASRGEHEAAAEAHRGAVKLAEERLPGRSVSALLTLFGEQDNTRGLIALKELQASYAQEPETKRDLLLEVATLYRETILDPDRALEQLGEVLAVDEFCVEAQRDYGELLFDAGRFPEAVDWLTRFVDTGGDLVEVDHVKRLAYALRNLGRFDRAMEICLILLERDPGNRDAREIRVEVMDARGQLDGLEEELRAYVVLLDDELDRRLKFSVYSRLAQLSLERDDLDGARASFEAAAALNEEDINTVAFLRDIAVREERWKDAVDFSRVEMESAEDGDERRTHFDRIERILRDELGDEAGAVDALKSAAELSPTDLNLQLRLLEHYEEEGNWEDYLGIAVGLMNVADGEELGTTFFTRVAEIYQEQRGDLESARLFYTRALEYDPENAALRTTNRTLAREAGDWGTFARIEAELLEDLEDFEDKICRSYELAHVHASKLGDEEGYRDWLSRAHALVIDDRELARDIADKYTLEDTTYGIARDIYGGILSTMPRDPEVIRIMARLSGQMHDVDRAYGYYSTLAALSPMDDEARGYIKPCRRARPKTALRPIKDIERMRIAPPSAGALIASLFNPLARAVERLRRGDMQLRGVTERDRLSPTDKRTEILVQTLETVGLEHSGLYLWRGGGFEAAIALDGGPAVLLGSTLLGDATDGERLFLVARAAQLNRSGHTLCGRLSAEGLQGLLAAMALAVDPTLAPPGLRDEGRRLARQLSDAMGPAQRERLLAAAQAYCDKAGIEDVEAWQLTTLKSANRAALLLSGDVEEAITALLRVEGRETLYEDGRGALVHGSTQSRDLIDFSTSEDFFVVRRDLGLLLPEND
ncbi:MAG: tetratricopeptide repeat protein [Myxococcota bacterium]|nr:tetratricopeptide repeat protein [Myxococcota bacterium]